MQLYSESFSREWRDSSCRKTMKDYGSVEEGASEDLRVGVKAGSSDGGGSDFVPASNRQKTKIHGSVSCFPPHWLVAVITCIALLLYALFTRPWCSSHEPSENWSPIPQEEFDYIVVGGGPAGIIVATKLAQKLATENSKLPGRVLLLESGASSQSSVNRAIDKNLQESSNPADVHWSTGTESLNKFDIPLMWSGISNSPGRRDKIGLSSENVWSPNHWPMKPLILARALGGCGLMNAMIYIRALSTDFDHWPGDWSWKNILEHYKELENFDESHSPVPSYWENEIDEDKKWRGKDGPITTTPSGPAIDAVAPLFLESFLAAGLPLASRGFNHPDPKKREGAGYYEFNIAGGVRDSVAASMIGKGSLPSNLVIKTDTTVSRVIMDHSDAASPRAIGVEFFSNQNRTKVIAATLRRMSGATGEVILSAGAILTPQLLANSGISEGGEVKDLPGVGKNLQDHPAVALVFRITPKMAERSTSIYTFAGEMEDYTLAVDLIKDLKEKKNVSPSQMRDVYSHLGTVGTSGFSAGAFLRSPWATDARPDLQLTVFPRVIEPHLIDRSHKLNQQRSANDGNSVQIPIESSAMLVTVALLQPEARYEVKTSQMEKKKKSTSTSIRPDMNHTFGGFDFPLPSVGLPPNKTSYLSDLDVQRLAWGLEEVRRIRSFAPLSRETEEELYPGSSIVDGLLDNHVKEDHLTNSHWSGSTKMGSTDDPTAVVDERLRVIGVEGLRVADAGVMPRVPNGNTHSTVCVVANRAAELIFEDRTSRKRFVH